MMPTEPDGPDSSDPARWEDLRGIMSNERKVAIVTGASQGIGAGLVKEF
jgi:hypothetical protein